MISPGIGSSRYPLWIPLQVAAKLVEGWQHTILQRIVRVPYREDCSREVYCRERNRIVLGERDRDGLRIQTEWALCLVRWLEHLPRHPDAPAAKLVWTQEDTWLQTIRALQRPGNLDSLSGGATGTRSGRGKP